MIPHELAEDFYALIGTIAGHDVDMSGAEASDLATVLIDAGFRWVERE